jgi:hypothetical protein
VDENGEGIFMIAGQNIRVHPLEPERLAELYLTAKEYVIKAGFADEIDWQEGTELRSLDEATFLREAAWVVLSTGFRETILRRRFGEISKAFLHWVSADLIIAEREACREAALESFCNRRKIDAIVEIVERVANLGIDEIREQILNRGKEFLEELPFIGPVTSCHLAKNLGISMVKPDRHLSRIATVVGYQSPDQMCQVISEVIGDSSAVIDIVLWRYATIGEIASWYHNI